MVTSLYFMYLINKPQLFGKITRWLLLFLKYDFKIVYKHGRFHLMANALSRLPNEAKSVGVPDQTTNAHLFILQLEWLQNVYDYLLKGMMPKRFTISQTIFGSKS